jgi:hypothetical protein
MTFPYLRNKNAAYGLGLCCIFCYRTSQNGFLTNIFCIVYAHDTKSWQSVGTSIVYTMKTKQNERLQGFPDYWTNIPGASDSARYKALGNSVAIPCVEHVLRGIAFFLRKFHEEQEESECTSTPTI